jgi:hypothetical protein
MELTTIIISILLIITALVTIYYWADFFFRGTVHVINEEWYIKFERSFPIADLWGLVVCSLLGAAGLLTKQSYGPFFALLAASSMIFLALQDITFNIQNNMYHFIPASNEMTFELIINLWTLALGIALIIYLWPILT